MSFSVGGVAPGGPRVSRYRGTAGRSLSDSCCRAQGLGRDQSLRRCTLYSSPAIGAPVITPGDIWNGYLAHGREGAPDLPTRIAFKTCGDHGSLGVKFK